jgi:hypothetical protein
MSLGCLPDLLKLVLFGILDGLTNLNECMDNFRAPSLTQICLSPHSSLLFDQKNYFSEFIDPVVGIAR